MIRSTVIEQYVKSSTRPAITVADVALSFKETNQWIFVRLIVKIWQCNLDPIRIVVQSDSPPNHTEHLVENPEIVIHNSSFSSLDLKPGSKAQIIDCYIDAQFKPRPTLITANNSDVSIQNCHFGNFINENGSTVLYGHSNSHVIIENSAFIQHNSPKGVFFLQNNCYMFINYSTHSNNVASSPGYSPVSLLDKIHAVMINTVFSNNSAVSGGAVIARFKCKIALTNCTFSSNKAITRTTERITKNLNLQRSVDTPEQNMTGTITPVTRHMSTSFNLTSSHDKKPKAIAAQLLVRIRILGKNSVQQEGTLLELYPGQGGAIYVAIQSQILVTNCTFEENSAQLVAGAIVTVSNTTLHVQETTFVGNKAQHNAGAIAAGLNAKLHIEETTFVSNKAHEAGAINIEQQAYLRMKHCVFDDNIGGRGGAIGAGWNATLKIQETNFTRNRAALGGGAIDVDQQSYLRMTNCVLDDNISEWLGGAIIAAFNVTLDIQETNFTRNRAALQGGAIDLQHQCYLRITDCTFKENGAESMGGAIVSRGAVLEINGSYFSNNTANFGGAIDVQQQANLSLTNCRLEYNFATDHAGAIATYSNVILRIQETNFTGNSAAHQGGALCMSTLTDCYVEQSVFDCNTAEYSGGAVYMEIRSSLKLENTNFTNNNATDGGAIYIQDTSNLQTNMCSFWKNVAKRAGGAITLKDYSTAVIGRCHFLSNHAVEGGAVSIDQPEHVSVHSTVLLRNVALDQGGAIGIINGTDVTINNITCVGNQGPNGGGCLYVAYVTLTLNNSDISKTIANLQGAGFWCYYFLFKNTGWCSAY